MMKLPRCTSFLQSVCKPRRLKTPFHFFSEKRPSLRILELLDYSCWKSIRMRFPEFRVFRKACFFFFVFFSKVSKDSLI